ncbi:MAG: alpha/beta hydrolase, partial [Armatimonadota bacterium]
ADGEDWLHRMRREYEWVDYKQRLAEDRKQRVLTGQSAMVSLREEIMIQTPERKETGVKKDVDSKLPELVPLACADAILQYKPIEVVDRIAPRGIMFIAVEPDSVTPEDHSYRMYERARPPKKLIVQRGTTHYTAYDQYGDIVTPMIVEWYNRLLGWGPIQAQEARLTEETVVYLHPDGQVKPLERVS